VGDTEQRILKRGGDYEPISLDKVHRMVEAACKDVSGVSASSVEMNSGLQFYDGMSSTEIQSILIKSAADLISLETPNYQYVAARLLLFQVRKSVFNTKWKDSKIYPPLKDIMVRNINKGVYDEKLITYYSDEELDKLDEYMKHDRDMMFTYAGLRQVVDKYLVQDRSSGELYESPQYMYMLIASVLFKEYPV
jgi:ribonucleoside-diphosphate reductase alpha chain